MFTSHSATIFVKLLRYIEIRYNNFVRINCNSLLIRCKLPMVQTMKNHFPNSSSSFGMISETL